MLDACLIVHSSRLHVSWPSVQGCVYARRALWPQARLAPLGHELSAMSNEPFIMPQPLSYPAIKVYEQSCYFAPAYWQPSGRQEPWCSSNSSSKYRITIWWLFVQLARWASIQDWSCSKQNLIEVKLISNNLFIVIRKTECKQTSVVGKFSSTACQANSALWNALLPSSHFCE